jgi:Protein of unknown function (DUF1236)
MANALSTFVKWPGDVRIRYQRFDQAMGRDAGSEPEALLRAPATDFQKDLIACAIATGVVPQHSIKISMLSALQHPDCTRFETRNEITRSELTVRPQYRQTRRIMNMKRKSLLGSAAVLLALAVSAAAQAPSNDAMQPRQPNASQDRPTSPQQPSAQGAQRDDQRGPSQGTQRDRPSPAQGAEREDQRNRPAQGAERGDQRNRPAQGAEREDQRNRPAQGAEREDQRNRPAQGAERAESDRTGGRAVRLSVQDQTRISQIIARERVEPARVNFSLRIGVEVPNSVRLHPLSTTIIDIVPEYRGYSYFVTEDSIVIVDPQTYEIVEVLPFEERARAEAAPAGRSRVQAPPAPPSQSAPSRNRIQFSKSQREIIRQHASPPRTVGAAPPRVREKVVIDEEVPESVELHEFPAPIIRHLPQVRRYRYYMQDDSVILVDPARRRVYDVIE